MEWLVQGLIYAVIVEAIFALVGLLIAFQAYKLYKFSKVRSIKLLALGFGALGVSNIIFTAMNLTFQLYPGHLFFKLLISSILLPIYVIIALMGWCMLTYMTLETKKRTTYFLILLLSLAVVFGGFSSGVAFFTVTIILIAFIILFLLRKFHETKNKEMLFAIIGFVFIIIGEVLFIMAFYSASMYLMAHLFQLVGYLMILFKLMRLSK